MASQSTSAAPHRPTVAVIGGGQLARMLQEAASPLSIELRVLVESSKGSAALSAPTSFVGLPTDLHDTALDSLLDGADVLTFEHEHIPASLFAKVKDRIPTHPAQDSLIFAQDKLAMRNKLSELGVAAPKWRAISTLQDLRDCGEELGYPFIVKTPRGGYDGHGVLIVRSREDVEAAIAEVAQVANHEDAGESILGGGRSAKGARVSIVAQWLTRGRLLAEEMVNFYDEISIQIARSPSGEMRTWTPVRSEQLDGVCSIVTAPAPDLSEDCVQRAQGMAHKIAQSLNITGVLAVEMFRVRRCNDDGTFHDELLVNELAMRPHNTGHWNIEGAVTSQFEQHLRAVLDLPLGATDLNAPHCVMVNLLGSKLSDPTHALATAMTWAPHAKIHLYGKEVRPGRKLGHVTVMADNPQTAREQAWAAMSALAGESEPQLPPPPPQP